MKITFVAIVAKETTSTVSQFYLAQGVHYGLDFEELLLDFFFVSLSFSVRKLGIGFRKKLRKAVTALNINSEYPEFMKYPVVG